MDDELNDLLASAVAPLGLELVDVERRSASVRVVVDRADGIDLDAIGQATRAVSSVLDTHDPFPGHRYTLEVSSPGVERPLKTPSHFARAVGEIVTVRTTGGGEGERRVTGRLSHADDDGFVLQGEDVPGGERRVSYDEVDRARTVFEWGAPHPRRGGRPSSRAPRAADGKPAGRKKVATP